VRGGGTYPGRGLRLVFVSLIVRHQKEKKARRSTTKKGGGNSARKGVSGHLGYRMKAGTPGLEGKGGKVGSVLR